MRNVRILAACLLLMLVTPIHALARADGYLFIIGGGRRSPAMMKRFLELREESSGGKLVIFPMTSSRPEEAGRSMAEEFKKLGVQDVEYHVLSREQALNEENTGILDNTDCIYFTGGDQSRLTAALVNTPIHQRLLEIYREGGVVGGTSAGAAVMSELMITGEEKRKAEEDSAFTTIQADNIVVTPGFGFIKTAIIDQHFVARKRHNRLISLVIEHPELLGIGIDETTAVIVNPDKTFEVVGEQNVVVYDATNAKIEILPSHSLSGFHIIMHVLKPGDRFDLEAKNPVK